MTDIPARLAAALSDRYRIERELGAGGMATVYLAYDIKHDRTVAIKVLKPELAAVLGAERFVVEIKTTAALQHPHILPLFDSGTADGFLYYVMPFIDGETLRGKLDRETQLGIDEAVRIASDVASALHYAHTHGVIHRDIKPENILLHDGRPMVADFGIALALSAAAGGRMTETGMSLGTPHYMSPEQATAEKEITARSDVYSLGSVLYEMLTGNPPHTGSSAQQIIMKIIVEPAEAVTKYRKSVPPNVAAAVATSLEKLPADRFASAAKFAEALANPGFSTARLTSVDTRALSARSWIRDSRTVGVMAIAAIALAAFAWASGREAPVSGPIAYDVGLPDSVALRSTRNVGFAVAPAGNFVVYETARDLGSELWYRSLRDATTKRIDGTEGGSTPTISPNGERVAFFRNRSEVWTVEVVPVAGGAPTTLGPGSGDGFLDWLADDRLRVVDNDGNRTRWFDPGGGPTTTLATRYCIMPFQLPDPSLTLCGGGGERFAYTIQTREREASSMIWTSIDDLSPVIGSHFQLVDARYLVYVTVGGDLVAAPVDVAVGRVGRPVRMVSGLGRREYSGAGTYGLSRSGTLVYATGVNQPVGHLVVAREGKLDTLPVGHDAFLRFSMSPDGRRLAAVVEGLEGEELRIYDLQTGRHVTWVSRTEVRQPVWSPRGDRLLFITSDSVFVGSPEQAGAPEFVFHNSGTFEGFSWMSDDRVIGVLWGQFLAAALHVAKHPAVLDTLVPDVSFVRPSPDGRWLAYSNRGITEIWLEPLPRNGQRYQVASGSIDEAHWLSNGELAITSYDRTGYRVERVTVSPATNPPVGPRRPWLRLPEFRGTAGQSSALSPDGGVIYVRGTAERPVHYLRVIPGWVEQMKRTVDEANQ